MKSKYILKNKHKGNVILMVVMVATVLIILSAVVTSALVFTTTGNTVVKYKNDYLYAAEGGIEFGIQKYEKDGSAGFPSEGISISYLQTISENADKGIKNVIVTFGKYPVGSERDCIISTVYGNDKNADGNDDELYKIALPVNEGRGLNDILKYTFCSATTIDMTVAGSSNLSNTQVACKPNPPGFNPETDSDNLQMDIQGGKVPPNNYPTPETGEDDLYLNTEEPKIKEARIAKATRMINLKSFTELNNTATNMKTIDIETAPIITNSIGKTTLSKIIDSKDGLINSTPTKKSVAEYTIILVNGDLKIDCSESGRLDNTILIVTGNFIIEPPAGRLGALPQQLTNTTIYSKSITIKSGATIQATNSPRYPISAYNIHNDDIKEVDKFLIAYMDNWGSSVSGGGASGDFDFGNVEYINP